MEELLAAFGLGPTDSGAAAYHTVLRDYREGQGHRSTYRQGPPRQQQQQAERWIAARPGVGQGMLDTLRRLHKGPLVFDTATVHDPRGLVYGQLQRGRDGARVVINPAAADIRPSEIPLTLVHEVLGHGVQDLGSSRAEEEAADLLGTAFLRQSGRANTPIEGTRGMASETIMRRLLQGLERQ